MHRRSFIKKTGATGIAMAVLPGLTLTQEIEYSIIELMGKTDIDLYGEGINLRKEAHDAFLSMKKAAYSAGIDLKIVSSFRNFQRQEAIFERKFITYTEDDGMEPLAAIEKIIEYSTIPGKSRHHCKLPQKLDSLKEDKLMLILNCNYEKEKIYPTANC